MQCIGTGGRKSPSQVPSLRIPSRCSFLCFLRQKMQEVTGSHSCTPSATSEERCSRSCDNCSVAPSLLSYTWTGTVRKSADWLEGRSQSAGLLRTCGSLVSPYRHANTVIYSLLLLKLLIIIFYYIIRDILHAEY